jgi:hypothetical protein
MNGITRLTPFSNMLDLLCQTIGSRGFRKLCAIVCFVGLLSRVLYKAYQAGCWVVLFYCRRLHIFDAVFLCPNRSYFALLSSKGLPVVDNMPLGRLL